MMILAVFRSRAHSLAYLQKLNEYGIMATAAPTPKEAKIGCGLCVRFDARYSSFKGFYKTDFINGRMMVTPYYGKG